MKYICTRAYSGVVGNGDTADIAYGAEFDTIGSFIAHDNKAVCRIGSQIAREYFALNDDGNGLERGAITHYLAFEHSFTADEAETLQTKYSELLNDGIFSQKFFDADIDTLRALMTELNLTISIASAPTTKLMLKAVNINYVAPKVPDLAVTNEANIDWAAIFNPSTYTTAAVFEVSTDTVVTDSTVTAATIDSDTTTEVTLIASSTDTAIAETLQEISDTLDNIIAGRGGDDDE